MKCRNCGNEFTGNFCPECGTMVEQIDSLKKEKKKTLLEKVSSMLKKGNNGKKSLIVKIVIIVVVVAIVGGIGFSFFGVERIDWNELILGDLLPEPPSTKGEIEENSRERLYVDISGLSEEEYNDYVKECEKKNFTIDVEYDSSSYGAFNKDGYKLSITYLDEDSTIIELEIPMELSTIIWPQSIAGNQLPAPKSTKGKFSYEYDDNFFVYVGDMTKEDYVEYVNECYNKGFNIDYNKGEKYFSAKNSEGWKVYVDYEGFNIISISISLPEDDDTDTTDTTDTTESADETDTNDTKSENTTTNSTDLDPSFKAAMDSYESFMNDYVEFMKKYNENPSDSELLSEYSDFLNKYTTFMDDFNAWGNKDLNTAETNYYLEVQTRVNKKLQEIAN